MNKKAQFENHVRMFNLNNFKCFNPRFKQECLSGNEMMLCLYMINEKMKYVRNDIKHYNGNTIKIDKQDRKEMLDYLQLGQGTYEHMLSKLTSNGIFYKIQNGYYLVNPYAFCKGSRDGLVKSLGIFRRGNIYLAKGENPFLIDSIDEINKKPEKENIYKSKGEEKIADYLEFEGLEFEYEYTFDECRHKNHLHFDFAVIHNDAIVLLIEFDGPHHFGPQKYNNITDEEAELNYKEQVKRDREKDKFARRKSIPLLRIPYYDEAKIDTIIFKELYRLNILQ